MSIYIKDMEMPTSCRVCHLKMNCDECEGLECFCLPLQTQIGYLDDLLTDKRRDDCPLVPVPQHGRLIDADAFIEKCEEMADKEDGNQLDALVLLRWFLEQNAPTIIPAEPPKEE